MNRMISIFLSGPFHAAKFLSVRRGPHQCHFVCGGKRDVSHYLIKVIPFLKERIAVLLCDFFSPSCRNAHGRLNQPQPADNFRGNEKPLTFKNQIELNCRQLCRQLFHFNGFSIRTPRITWPWFKSSVHRISQVGE